MRRSKSKTAEEATAELDERVPDASDFDERPLRTGTGARAAADLTMGADQDRIVDSIFDDFGNATEAYEQLKRDLTLRQPASQVGYGTIVDALDLSEENARKAAQLYATSKVAFADFEIDASIIEAGLHEQASVALEAEKAAGTRKKQITIADVDAYMINNFTDEVRSLKRRRERAKRAVDYLENLSERWKERCKDLRQMCARVRET
jgi:hypothetical protein